MGTLKIVVIYCEYTSVICPLIIFLGFNVLGSPFTLLFEILLASSAQQKSNYPLAMLMCEDGFEHQPSNETDNTSGQSKFATKALPAPAFTCTQGFMSVLNAEFPCVCTCHWPMKILRLASFKPGLCSGGGHASEAPQHCYKTNVMQLRANPRPKTDENQGSPASCG